MTYVVIDTDTGIDDFFAIAQALQSPELGVEALTTVGGNVPLRYATRNALRALEYAGRPDIAFAQGSARPLRGRFQYAFYFHGPGGLPARLPRPAIGPIQERAIDLLFRRATDTGARRPPFTLIALGPATNAARLLRGLRTTGGRHRVEHVMVMGGAVDVPGNVTPFAEFNTWNDHEAAAEVLDGDIQVTLVPLDVCVPVRITSGDFEQAHPTARRLGFAWLRRHPGRRLGLADCVAIAAATHPAAFNFEQIAVDVDTSSGPERGRTTRSRSGRRIRVAVRFDADRVLDLIRTRALAPVPGAGGARGKR